MKQLLDKWESVNPIYKGKTQFWMFVDTETKKVSCVSRCVHFNGTITYLMSDEKTPETFYGTVEEIKKIIKEFE